MINKIHSSNDFFFILKNHKRVFSCFIALWTDSSRDLVPFIEKLSNENEDIVFIETYVTINSNLCNELNINYLPKYIAFYENIKIGEAFADEKEIQNLIDKLKFNENK